MNPEKLKQLLDNGLITADQFAKIEPIVTGKIVSVYYELRIVLYLGVTLLTTGLGILIYENIGDIGHIVSIAGLVVLTVATFWYVFRYAVAYSDERVKAPTPYYDYMVLLGSLLFISVLTYLQVLYALFDDGMGATTLVTSAFFFYVAYRFDHLGVLSLAITALASFFSISISPQKWYSSDFFETAQLPIKSIVFGVVIIVAALVMERKKIKRHFTFTYVHFATLIFLLGSLAGVFMDDDTTLIYLLALYGGCGFAAYYGRESRSFLFLLYAFAFGYTGTTYCLTDTVLVDIGPWFFYLLLSCGGFVLFILRYRTFFKRSS
ncbi:MAG TPA: DUF2157 domain-containing protein [Chryseosolibacter sp.]|nr:DUF2157 domain-containing protein [Chryseosolibacter sp.]